VIVTIRACFRRWARAGLALAAVAFMFTGSASPSVAQSPSPGSDTSVSLVAEPLLGGNFRPGTWAAFRVLLENHGPVVDGELRLSSALAGGSKFARAIQLPPGARQEHIVYGRMGALSGRFTIELVSGATSVARQDVATSAASTTALGVFVVAEQPQLIVGQLRTAVTDAGRESPAVMGITPEQLPPRAEAWASADLIVWHDIDSARLDADRLTALRTWVATGGHLVIAAGSTGATTMGGFAQDMLPYQPSGVIDIAPADLASLTGAPPASASPVSVLTGSLERGDEIANIGGSTMAARVAFGRGSVAVVGVNPATSWIAESPAASVLWSKVLPVRLIPTPAESAAGDSSIVNALNGMPAIQMPRLDHLLVLIVAYIAAIGPLNYFVLRRRDRREWAWITMPATIVVFAVAAYAFGALLRGADVVVNELAIVSGAAGADRGLAQVYVGVYSPNRSTFDVRVGGDVLMSAPSAGARRNPFEPEPPATQEVDVLLGDPATLRGYTVGFGALRAFRSEASVSTPRVDADLKLVENQLDGSLMNASDVVLEDVVVLYGHSIQVVGDLAPGQGTTVSLATTGSNSSSSDFSRSVLDRLFPESFGAATEEARQMAARRAMLRHLAGGRSDFGQGAPATNLLSGDPVILAWVTGPTLDVDVGRPADHLGERLYVLPARATVTGPVAFTGSLVQRTTIAIDGLDAFEEGPFYFVTRGTATVEYRPVGFSGAFAATRAAVMLTERQVRNPSSGGDPLVPLPAEEQPDPDEPLSSEPRPDATTLAPRLQLFDRVAGTWVEFEPVEFETTYDVAEPARFVDASGALLARLVVRSSDEPTPFTMVVRLEGNPT
jgi:hypothetical protein